MVGVQKFAWQKARGVLVRSQLTQAILYEIYHKGNEYLGVVIGGNFRVEALEKKDDNYYIKGSITEDFYQIDGGMNIVLYDKNGDLSDMYEVSKE